MTVALSNLDRVLYPDAGFTKGDMIEYYRRIAPALLPHLRGRPLTMRRFPEGVLGPSWYQNQCRGGPSWLARRDVIDTTGKVWEFCTVDDERSLLWVANQGTIELHPLADPREAVFDLDPGPGADILDCCRVALELRELLDPRVRAKVSGSVGLHVHVPFDGDAKAYARGLAARLAA
jgi:bifunctional non-homologous end joining protein LigD